MPQTMCVVNNFTGLKLRMYRRLFHTANPPLVEGSLSSTPATQPLSHSAALVGVTGPATHPLSHSGAEWLRQPPCQSGCFDFASRVAHPLFD